MDDKGIALETVGGYLKRVRETLGYSLEEVSDVTKINPHYLEAIEKEDFSRLPAEIFVKGFLRSYAGFLGINEEEVIKKFIETKNIKKPFHEPPRPSISEIEKKRISIPPDKIKIFIPIGVVIVIFSLIMIFAGGNEERSAKSPSPPVEETEKIPGTPEGNIPVVATKDVKTPGIVATEGFKLKIIAKDMTWILAKIDERVTKDVLLRPGDTVVWRGAEKVVMTIGNAGGIEIEVDGKKYSNFGEHGEVIRGLVITNDGVEGWEPGETTGPESG